MKEDQEHLTKSQGYEDLRYDMDLSIEKELVDFFAKVMERRRVRGMARGRYRAAQ